MKENNDILLLEICSDLDLVDSQESVPKNPLLDFVNPPVGGA